MGGESIAPYVSQGIDAGVELRGLGLDKARYFLLHMQEVVSKSGYRSYWQGRAHRGRSVRTKEHQGCFIVYVVETERDNSVRATLIYAGRTAVFANDAAVQAVVEPRLKDFFR